MIRLLDLDPATYDRHRLHTTERVWTETNCYVDLWIELLHALGLDPVAGLAFTLSTDFDGFQWNFFKYPLEDLRTVYGLDVNEMNIWRPVIDHVEEQLDAGNLLTVEADSFHLPDTVGVSYATAHVKSTIVPQLVDRDARRLGYFHNAGYFEVTGDDFDGVFRLGQYAAPDALPPYVELVRLDHVDRDPADLTKRARQLANHHLSRRPVDNPVARLGKRLIEDLGWLAEQDLETFHLYAFGTCRQCGASMETAADFVDWLDARDGGGLTEAAANLRGVAEGARTAQLSLARANRGRTVDLSGTLSVMESQWEAAFATLVARYG